MLGKIKHTIEYKTFQNKLTNFLILTLFIFHKCNAAQKMMLLFEDFFEITEKTLFFI